MFTIKNASIFLGLALAGCAASKPETGGGDGSGSGSGSGEGSGSGSGGGEINPTPLDASGKYSMVSTYNIAQNMPGTVGTVVNDFIAASNDPGKFVLDQIIAQSGISGTFKSILQGAEPFLAGLIDQQITNYAPSWVATIQQVGQDFGDMAQQFGLNEELDVAKANGAYVATETVLGAHFTIGGVASDYNFSDYNVQNVVVSNVGLTIDTTGAIKIAENQVPIAFGKILRIGLDAAIIPMIDSNAYDLGSLLTDNIDCNAVGQTISDNVPFGDATTWANLCVSGLQFGANAVYQQIDKIDQSALMFDQTGTARGVQGNNDGRVDTIQSGKWAGTCNYAGTPAPLATATFTAHRM